MSLNNIRNIIEYSRVEIISSLEIHAEQCFNTLGALNFPKGGYNDVFHPMYSSGAFLLLYHELGAKFLPLNFSELVTSL